MTAHMVQELISIGIILAFPAKRRRTDASLRHPHLYRSGVLKGSLSYVCHIQWRSFNNLYKRTQDKGTASPSKITQTKCKIMALAIEYGTVAGQLPRGESNFSKHQVDTQYFCLVYQINCGTISCWRRGTKHRRYVTVYGPQPRAPTATT